MAMTIEQIASNLGVSVTTVKVVNNGKADQYRISQKTQKRVKEFIKEHGIVINQAARSLKLKKSYTLGLVVPNVINIFFPYLMDAFEREVDKLGYKLIISSYEGSNHKGQEVIVNLVERGVDGLFVVLNSLEQQLKIIEKFPQKPMVFLDQDYKVKGQSVVISNNNQAFSDLTTRILEQEVSELYVISGGSELPSISSRLEGIVSACKQANMILAPNWLYRVPENTIHDGYQGMKLLFSDIGHVPEAIIFSSIAILEGALQFLKRNYGSIPNDMIIGTFDEHSMLEFLPNPIISVAQDELSIAVNACQIMLNRFNNQTLPKKVVIPTKIITRNI